MKESDWYETYVHLSHDHENINPMIYQPHLNYGRDGGWYETYMYLSYHNQHFIMIVKGTVADILIPKSMSSIIITIITYLINMNTFVNTMIRNI